MANLPVLGPKVHGPELPNVAPEGYVWYCTACGKITRDRYGNERGWDEACMLNAVIIERRSLSHD